MMMMPMTTNGDEAARDNTSTKQTAKQNTPASANAGSEPASAFASANSGSKPDVASGNSSGSKPGVVPDNNASIKTNTAVLPTLVKERKFEKILQDIKSSTMSPLEMLEHALLSIRKVGMDTLSLHSSKIFLLQPLYEQLQALAHDVEAQKNLMASLDALEFYHTGVQNPGEQGYQMGIDVVHPDVVMPPAALFHRAEQVLAGEHMEIPCEQTTTHHAVGNIEFNSCTL